MQIVFVVLLTLLAIPATAETRLDLYRGRILCTIDRVCELGSGCRQNNQYLDQFILDFRDDGRVVVDLGVHEPADAMVLSDRPDGESLKWWHLAWVTGTPWLLQIGFGHEFTLIQGPLELQGFDASPPVVRRGRCQL